MKDVVVVGGGTAGWLTALFVRKKLPNLNVTLIESSEIGILGAGEGTTPHFINLLKDLNISLLDIFKHANGTIKNGIKFTNWNGDSKSYFHPFFDEKTLLTDPFFVGKKIAQGDNLDSLVPSALISSVYKAKIQLNQANDFIDYGNCALHFDARLLASFLKKIGIERGVKLVDGIVKTFDRDDNNNIVSLTLENNQTLQLDFLFDCTGFKRMFIGKHYKSEWVTYKNNLPVNKAIAFFIPDSSTKVPPYTEAIAMKYGWVWKIPVQGRFGCGYVFDSNSINEQQAVEELKQTFGEIEIARSFSFEPGCYKELWKGNCIALGLASGFIEPLEATSIWVTILTLQNFLNNISGASEKNKRATEVFNRTMHTLNEQILAFIYFHYITKRTDTDFWKNFRSKNTQPEYYNAIENEKDYINYNDLGKVLPGSFDINSLLAVGAGINFFSQEAGTELSNRYQIINPINRTEKYNVNTHYLIQNAKRCLDHYTFLNMAKSYNV